MPTLGLDIGGANLKGATSDGRAAAMSFPLWKSPERLTDMLIQLEGQLAGCDRIAVTMTGELADCFATKADGVHHILRAVDTLANGRPVSVWSTEGTFLCTPAACESWLQVAAANWHALATWAGRFAPRGGSLLIDIGSTTTDLIPLREGVPCSLGRTDGERLMHGELLYTGVRRTPLCAVRNSVTWRGKSCRIAAEWFATMLDVYLITGDIPPDELDCDTADGRPATIERAFDRLARMVCCDRTEITDAELCVLGEEFARSQRDELCSTITDLMQRQPIASVICSGTGLFLARRGSEVAGKDVRVIDLAEHLSPTIAESACAYAVACLCAGG